MQLVAQHVEPNVAPCEGTLSKHKAGAKPKGKHYPTADSSTTTHTHSVFCSGLKKGMVLIEEKGHFCSRNYILRELLCAKLFSEGTLHKFWATHLMFEM